MSYTFDGQPPTDLKKVLDAMLAAAWLAGRDAAAWYAEHGAPGMVGEWMVTDHDPNVIARAIRALTPPADLEQALPQHIAAAVRLKLEELMKSLPADTTLVPDDGGNWRLQWTKS